MKKVSGAQVVTTAEALENPLLAEIQNALGELVGAAGGGIARAERERRARVVHSLMEREVT